MIGHDHGGQDPDGHSPGEHRAARIRVARTVVAGTVMVTSVSLGPTHLRTLGGQASPYPGIRVAVAARAQWDRLW